jgi:hypothetical protein
VPDDRQQILGTPEFLGKSTQPLLTAAGDRDPVAGIEQSPRDRGADTSPKLSASLEQGAPPSPPVTSATGESVMDTPVCV